MRIDNPARLTVSPERHWSRYPSVILDRDGNFCVSWYRYPPPDSGETCGIVFCRGNDRLDTIAAGEPVRVTRDRRNHTGATLCQDGSGQYHLAWHCWPERMGLRYLLISHSADGESWAEPTRPLPQIEEYMLYPSLAWHPSGRFWLAFSAGPGPDFYPTARIYLTTSADGKAWEVPVPFAPGEQGDNKGVLAIGPDGELMMAWRRLEGHKYRLRWSASADGRTWREAEKVPVGCEEIDRPKLSFDNSGRPWLAYEGDGRIWVCRMEPGRGWTQAQQLDTGATVESRPSAPVQNRSGDFWLAWTSQRIGMEVWAGQLFE